jgi:hypothetical protein
MVYIVIGSFPINEFTSVCNLVLLMSHARRLGPSLGWAVMTMASVATIATPVLLAGESVGTPGLWSFRALVMSLRGEILGFLIETLV